MNEKALLKFTAEMYSYQKKLNSKCQCEDCTLGEPAPGKVIKDTIMLCFDEDEREILQDLAEFPWKIEDA